MKIKELIKSLPCVESYLFKKRYDAIVDMHAWPLEKRVEDMMKRYEAKFGYRMDVNNPKTFTEKIQWYKAYYTGDGHLERVADKYLLKQYVKEKIGEGHTVPVLGAWTNIKDLEHDWNKLPEEFCLKSNVQSEGRWIEFIHRKSEMDFNSKRKEWAKWFLPKLTLINGLTQAYRNCIPRVFAEQYLENVRGQLFDYKVFCFDGEPFCIESAKERFEGGIPVFTFYDLEWNKLDVTSGDHPNHDIPKPQHLGEMLKISKTLSQGFPHIRVDFFDTEDKLYVAEMTLYTGGGYSYYRPQSFNEKMGELFILPIERQ